MKALIILLALFLIPPPKGHLLIAGGNLSDRSVYQTFIRLAGEKPIISVITHASSSNRVNVDFWKDLGAAEVYTDSFPANVTAVWIQGGDQANLERYAKLHPEFERGLVDIYRKGGTIAGTSAGAAIMSKAMIRGDTDGIPEIGVGFDLLPDSIIDQHFSQRNRLNRLRLAKIKTGLIGVGIDENTACLYDGKTIKVLGQHTVTIMRNGGKEILHSGEVVNFP